MYYLILSNVTLQNILSIFRKLKVFNMCFYFLISEKMCVASVSVTIAPNLPAVLGYTHSDQGAAGGKIVHGQHVVLRITCETTELSLSNAT